MKNEYIKEIKESMKDKMKEKDFKIKGQSFIRVVNKQIYQEINFQGSAAGDSFTVNIAIIPICGIKKVDPYIRIGFFISGEDIWWTYTKNSISEVVNIINEKILKIMDSLTTYEELYTEIESLIDNISLYKKDNNNYKASIMYHVGNINLFWLCFRNNKFDKCKDILKLEKDDVQVWLNRCLKVEDDFQKQVTSEKLIKRFEDNKNKLKQIAQERINKIEELNTLLNNNEFEKLQKMTNEIELENLNRLNKYCF